MLALSRLYAHPDAVSEPRFFRRHSSESRDEVDEECLYGLDADDPRVTGAAPNRQMEYDEVEAECREQMRLMRMTYHERRTEAMKIKIEFNVTSMMNRRAFIMTLARALISYGAPSHRIESQLVSTTRILEVDAQFVYLPGLILASFGDPETHSTETHVVKCNGKLNLGSLRDVHTVYREVVHDEISAKEGTRRLRAILERPPIYPVLVRCAIASSLSGIICVLSWGGSFLDMWIAAASGGILAALQLIVVPKHPLFANIYEVTAAVGMSLIARALSSIRTEIFCYNSIAYASIVGLLPGFLVLTSSLELASKNLLCGSVKMVYSLVYALFIGFSLKIGSDLYLHMDKTAVHELSTMVAAAPRTVLYQGTFIAESGLTNGSLPSSGVFKFMNQTMSSSVTPDIVMGCFRPPGRPWFLQAWPTWTRYILVPTYATLSSLKNLQPWHTVDLVVMVAISCVSYTANKVAKSYIFQRSEIVSAIGAFVVGVLGNVYSRKFGGTAFTVMVTGVLFLVPNGLSQTSFMDAGNGIEIGGAMINVAVGITVGLFMSQALVYAFGNSKNAAVFSF
ncbi:DUF1212-domain-containing protein [Vararia minispora EC-137]|uniref:DUF1212-domain-containing protein n=1 Tax=Vararia minispora EC-137 TaxID=1314806 RepID=A0ACB8QTI4_9AGAM|nr:DUF1212-domain-containing protein [Vararia minispora EC-137]